MHVSVIITVNANGIHIKLFFSVEVINIWKDLEMRGWMQFHALTKGNTRNIFRGQKSAKWNLVSSLHREINIHHQKLNNSIALKIEDKMIQEFLSSYHLYSDEKINVFNTNAADFSSNRLEVLSIMQHYGSPTRFLDWTFSPIVALFFALDGAEEDACVYVLNSEGLESNNKETFELDIKKSNRAKPFSISSESSKDIPAIFTYQPIRQNKRIRSQQGLFLVPSVIDKSFDEIISEYNNDEQEANNLNAYRLIIKKEDFQEFWFYLKHFNVTHETIYGGFEGFCKSLKHHSFDLESFDDVKREQSKNNSI